jgi:hypothetical protein
LRLRQHNRCDGEENKAERGHEHEDRLPPEQRIENAAKQRRDHRRHHHHRGDEPDQRGGAFPVRKVADDRPTHHDADRGAERLHHPREHKLLDTADENPRRAHGSEQRQAAEHHRAPPEAIGEKAHHQLRDREAEQEQRDGELHHPGIGIERHGEARHRRHQDVERQRGHAGYGHEQAEQGP